MQYFPNPTKAKKPRKNQPEEKNIYKAIQQYFENGNVVDLLTDTSNEVYKNELDKAVSYTHLRAHETVFDLVCRLMLDKKKQQHITQY